MAPPWAKRGEAAPEGPPAEPTASTAAAVEPCGTGSPQPGGAAAARAPKRPAEEAPLEAAARRRVGSERSTGSRWVPTWWRLLGKPAAAQSSDGPSAEPAAATPGGAAGRIYDWGPQEVAAFLSSLALDGYLPIFESIDGATLTTLSEDDLTQLGVADLLSRKKLVGHIARRRLQCVASVQRSNAPAAAQPLSDAASGCTDLVLAPRAAEDASLAVQRDEWARAEALRAGLQGIIGSVREVLDREAAESPAPLAQELARECADQLRRAEEAAQPREVHIPLFGTTGAGKSTLLNALLAEEVVPTSGWRACTSVPVELKSVGGEGPFEGEVHLKSPAEWSREVEDFLTDLLMTDRTRVNRREPVREGEPTPGQVAWDTLCAVYPEAFRGPRHSQPWPSLAAAASDLRNTRNRVTSQHAVSQLLRFADGKAAAVARQVLEYVDSPDAEGVASFWPLVKRVRITGPFGAHPAVVLVDAPGVQDANSARGAVVKQLLEEAGGVVIVSAIKRAANEKVAQEMLGERFRRQLLMDGHYGGALAFVATCTDELTLSELRRNLQIDESVGQLDAAKHRNLKTKQKIAKDCYAGLRRVQQQGEMRRTSTDAELRRSGVAPAVFTTSARDYQKLRGLLDTGIDGHAKVWGDVQDTEIPALRLWLHAQGQKAALSALISAKEKVQALCEKLQDVGNASLEEGLLGRWAEQARCKVQECIDGAIEQHHGAMQSRFGQGLMQRIRHGHSQSAEVAAQTMAPKCRPSGQGGMHHGTFKATARRKGEWKEDWNEMLADPLNRAIVVEWDATLNHRLPDHVDEMLGQIRSDMWRLQRDLSLPSQPFKDAVEVLDSGGTAVKSSLRRRQMELSRQIKENIRDLMSESYARAEGERGPGMDVRQKQVIHHQVSHNGPDMFRKASDFLTGELDGLLEHLREQLAALEHDVLVALERAMVLTCAHADEMKALQRLRDACASSVAGALSDISAIAAQCQELSELASAKEAAVRVDNATDDGATDESAEIPHECFCPITQSIMSDPVSTADGHTYERASIEKWLEENTTSPVTGLHLTNRTLIPNHSLRKIIGDLGLS